MREGVAYQSGYIVGRLFVIALLIGGAVWLGRRLGRKHNPPRFVAWPLVVAVLLVLGTLGAQMAQIEERARGGDAEEAR